MHADWATATTAPGSIFQVPVDVLNILPSSVRRILKCEEDQDLKVVRDIDLLDLFAGKARVARWGELLNFRVAAMDREFGSHFDLCSDIGFASTLCAVMRVKTTGMIMLGPQCSSWVWLSRSASRRSLANPYGDPSVASVAEGNVVNERVAMICAICSMLGIVWLVEQPASSLFFNTELMSMVVAKENAFQRHFFMKEFGHANSKPTLLFGVASFLSSLGTAFKKTADQAKENPD